MTETTNEIKLRLGEKLQNMSKKEAVTFLTETEPQLSNIAIASVLNCNATYVSQLKSKLRGTTSKKASKAPVATPKATRKTTDKKSKSTTKTSKAARRKAKTTVFAKKAVQTDCLSDGNIFDIRRTLQAMANTYSIEQLKIAIQDIENHG